MRQIRNKTCEHLPATDWRDCLEFEKVSTVSESMFGGEYASAGSAGTRTMSK